MSLRNNRILFLILTVGVTANALWSARLQVMAAGTQSKLDEHHKSLQQNQDYLDDLSRFVREVSVSEAEGQLDDAKAYAVDISDQAIKLMADEALLQLIETQIGIKVDKSNFWVGEGPAQDTGVVMMTSTTGRRALVEVSEKGAIVKTEGTLPVILKIAGAKNFHVRLDPVKNRVEIMRGGSILRVGTGISGEGVELGEADTGTVAVTKGNGVGIRTSKAIYMLSDGDIEIKAEGDINIVSEKGSVRINGEKVQLNG